MKNQTKTPNPNCPNYGMGKGVMVTGFGEVKRNSKMEGPAEQGNQSPPNHSCFGAEFKGSFLATGWARSQVKCSCWGGGGVPCLLTLWGQACWTVSVQHLRKLVQLSSLGGKNSAPNLHSLWRDDKVSRQHVCSLLESSSRSTDPRS